MVIIQDRFHLIEKIRREKHVMAKGKTFSLHGYIRDGIDLDDHEWTVEFIVDPDYSGILQDAKNRRIKIIDSFESDLAFGTHLIDKCSGEIYKEYIGLNRNSDNSVGSDSDSNDEEVQERRSKWAQPCKHPVFTFTHSLFEQYVFDTTGIIITDVKNNLY
jgi:hypothetical protein